jgi:biotin carboxyl carrier protein
LKKFKITVNGQSYEVEVEEIDPSPPVEPTPVFKGEGRIPSVPASKPSKQPRVSTPTGGEIVKSPMPGKIVGVKVKPGDKVVAGDVLVILEAMKMENEIMASLDGTVQEVKVSDGMNVNPGDVLVVID